MNDYAHNAINRQHKILRDLVHGYITLTEFDLSIIDTPHFQRLKDIRQLTSQHLFPGARHTRFDHSLGVMELTRQAIRHINANGFLTPAGDEFSIDSNLEASAALAALLHDVGHFPFSHLGEQQFGSNLCEGTDGEDRKKNLQKDLVAAIKKRKISGVDIADLKNSIKKGDMKSHEMMSCLVILEKYYDKIQSSIENKKLGSPAVADFELIIRCILGIPYKIIGSPKTAIKNIMVGLINSKTLDMDKLDYIMRDTFYTGIDVPRIDTQRLFKNMYISKQYELVFTSRAVWVLQTIIEARDNLYLWVNNNHTVVYTDFLYSYIFRRMRYNNEQCPEWKKGQNCQKRCNGFHCLQAGKIDICTLFSSKAILEQYASDSTLQQILNDSYRGLNDMFGSRGRKPKNKSCNSEKERTWRLLKNLFEREHLKPWWKTVFEYDNFMKSRILDDIARDNLPKRVCNGMGEIPATELRSHIAKGVIVLSKEFAKDKKLSEPLEDGDFFIIERSNTFYTLESIGQFNIYLRKNEINNAAFSQDEPLTQEGEYFAKHLSNLVPQKKYEDFFTKNSFYLFSRQYKEKKDYEAIEKIFVAVASHIAKMTEKEFKNFCEEIKKSMGKNFKVKKLVGKNLQELKAELAFQIA